MSYNSASSRDPSRLGRTFQELRARGEGALLGYLMAGDPDLPRSLEYARALLRGGVDVLELGVPFSDPIADGPVIQGAGVRALRAGTTPERVFELVTALRRDPSRREVPLVLLTYYNPVLAMGERNFCRRCAEVEVDGLIVPDLPVEEAVPLQEQAERYRLDVVFLATPETDEERLRTIAARTRGFLYLVSRYGVTGSPTEVDERRRRFIQRVRGQVPRELPLVVGFGISVPSQVEGVLRAGADGAVVGTAFVERIAQGAPPEALRGLAARLKAATRRAGPQRPIGAPRSRI